ncbi:MAG: SGNH/GDSL hydrolase family protein [Myxococcota bacterium]
MSPPDSVSRPLGRPRRALLEAVVVVAITWGALGAYAARDEPVALGGVALAQYPFRDREALVVSPPAEGGTSDARARHGHAMAARRPASEGHPAGGAARPALIEAPQRILLFGDSMLDELMLRFADYAAHNGHELFPVIWYGAGVIPWSQGDKLDQLRRELRPTVVVAVVGSNDLLARRMAPRRAAVARILEKLEGVPLLWIGPPSWTEDTGITTVVASAVGPERYFDSAELFAERRLARAGDGIHPTRSAARAWMDAVAVWVMGSAVHPMALRPPRAEAARPVARVFAPPGHPGGS